MILPLRAALKITDYSVLWCSRQAAIFFSVFAILFQGIHFKCPFSWSCYMFCILLHLSCHQYSLIVVCLLPMTLVITFKSSKPSLCHSSKIFRNGIENKILKEKWPLNTLPTLSQLLGKCFYSHTIEPFSDSFLILKRFHAVQQTSFIHIKINRHQYRAVARYCSQVVSHLPIKWASHPLFADKFVNLPTKHL